MLKSKWPLAILLIAAAVNILPMLLFTIGGDSDFQFVLIDCFARQFWQGDLYLRWCLAANAGLGAPLFLFYFPLPYYLTALLFPLTQLGLSLYGLFALGMFLATFVTGLTCYRWLRDIVSPGKALMAALLFLFIPYRMEAMLFRASYAEVWAIALLPLLMQYTRRLGKGDNTAALPLAGVFALLFLTHLPAAVVGVIMSGGYLIIVSWRHWLSKWRYDVSLLWGAAMAAFYLVPAGYYRRYMASPPLTEGPHGWPNTYLSWRNITELGQGRVVVTIALTVLALALLATFMLWRRKRAPDAYVQREIIAWSMLSALALFLLLPISAPIYALIGPLNNITFPWRMQIIFPFALAFLMAVWMQYFTSAKRPNSWKGDFSLLLALLALISYFVIGVREDTSDAAQQLVAAHYAGEAEYRSLWTDKQHLSEHYILVQAQHHQIKPEIISGKGTLLVQRKGNKFTLYTESRGNITVRVDQYFFPVWSAMTEEKIKLPLHAQPASGLMLVDVPPGIHRITLSYSVARSNPWLGVFELSSAAAFLFWLWRSLRARHYFDNASRTC